MKPLRKSSFEWCWNHETFMLYLFNTSMSKFRDVTDIDPVLLVSQTSLLNRSAILGLIKSKYYCTQDNTNPKQIFKHLVTWKPKPVLYCINDNMINPNPAVIQYVRNALTKYLPHQQDHK